MRLKHRVGICIGIVTVAIGWLWFSTRSEDAPKPVVERQVRVGKTPKKLPKRPIVKAHTNIISRVAASEDDTMSPGDRKICQDIQMALDNEDKEALRKALAAARNSANPEVRKNMVEALGWFGKGMIGEMACFPTDADADVRELAGNNWQIAVSEIDDEEVKAGVVEQTLLTVSDEGLSDMLASEINGMDERLAVNTIMRIVKSGTPAGVKAAKEAYQFVTGEEWVSADEAYAWLQENYTPSEDK